MRQFLSKWFRNREIPREEFDFSARVAAIRALQHSGHAFDFEGMLEQHYRRFLRTGDTVIDVGAHTGRHLSRFVECVGKSGRVVAFEPLPVAFQELQARFTQPNVVLRNCALANQAGTVSFVHAQGAPEESGLRQRIYNRPDLTTPVEITVPAELLDSYVDEVPGLTYVKIDVEGGEMDVLQGGRRLIDAHRPYLSVEYGKPGYSVYGHSLFTLFDFSQTIGYVMYDIFGHRLGRSEWPMSCDSICWDFFMVPAEHVDAFEAAVAPVRIGHSLG